VLNSAFLGTHIDLFEEKSFQLYLKNNSSPQDPGDYLVPNPAGNHESTVDWTSVTDLDAYFIKYLRIVLGGLFAKTTIFIF